MAAVNAADVTIDGDRRGRRRTHPGHGNEPPRPALPRLPTSIGSARVLSRSVLADGTAKVSWRAIAEKMGITRVEAMKLGYSLEDVIAEIKALKAAR